MIFGGDILPRPSDITGLRYNHLTAITKAPSRSGHTYWRFRCDCGTEKEIMKCHVINGAIKSCGCLFDAITNTDRFIPTDSEPRICNICNNTFYGFIGDTRVFCYNCSPRGVSVADAHRFQKRAMKHILVEYKGGQCVECGYSKCEGALQFHHQNENDKDFTLSEIKPNVMSMEDIKNEADKCVLLCANCHAKKHAVEDIIGVVMKLPPKINSNATIKQCKVCNNEFATNNYARSYCYHCAPYGVSVADAMRSKKRAIKHELLKYKGGAVCAYCGYDEYEGALQLHYRNPSTKDFTFSKTPLNDTNFDMNRMKHEADKCDVLCANCHAEIHYKIDDIDYI